MPAEANADAAPRVVDASAGSRYEAYLGDELAGFLDYHAQPGLVTLLHTEVARAYEGRGVGSALVRFALDDIRARGARLLPICPFVRAYLERHPEERDLLRAD
jgi:predicted GNAT family acetyltransferase